jgi:hypothetical protein
LNATNEEHSQNLAEEIIKNNPLAAAIDQTLKAAIDQGKETREIGTSTQEDQDIDKIKREYKSQLINFVRNARFAKDEALQGAFEIANHVLHDGRLQSQDKIDLLKSKDDKIEFISTLLHYSSGKYWHSSNESKASGLKIVNDIINDPLLDFQSKKAVLPAAHWLVEDNAHALSNAILKSTVITSENKKDLLLNELYGEKLFHSIF